MVLNHYCGERKLFFHRFLLPCCFPVFLFLLFVSTMVIYIPEYCCWRMLYCHAGIVHMHGSRPKSTNHSNHHAKYTYSNTQSVHPHLQYPFRDIEYCHIVNENYEISEDFLHEMKVILFLSTAGCGSSCWLASLQRPYKVHLRSSHVFVYYDSCWAASCQRTLQDWSCRTVWKARYRNHVITAATCINIFLSVTSLNVASGKLYIHVYFIYMFIVQCN